MKIVLIILVIIFSSSKSYSNDFFCKFFDFYCETIGYKKVEEREKKFYKLYSLIPFTGNITLIESEFMPNDYLYKGEEGKVIDGLKHGEWKTYIVVNQKKKLRKKEVFNRGDLKESSFWENGKLITLRSYNNDLLDGKYEDWSSLISKELKIPDEKGDYLKGNRVGCWKYLRFVKYLTTNDEPSIRNDYYIEEECYVSKNIIDTKIYGIGHKLPLYSGKKNHHGCYFDYWLKYNFKGQIKQKVNLGECTIGGDFVENIEKFFKFPHWYQANMAK